MMRVIGFRVVNGKSNAKSIPPPPEASAMSDHCHINLRIELYDQFPMINNGEGERIRKRLEEQVTKILENEGFFGYQYFVTGSVY